MGDVKGYRNRKAGVPTTVPESRNESDLFRHAGAQVTGTGGPEVPRGISSLLLRLLSRTGIETGLISSV